MIKTLLKINLSKIGWEGGRSTSIWIMSLNLLGFFLEITPKQTCMQVGMEVTKLLASGSQHSQWYFC